MEDRYGNRTMARWLIARYKRRKDMQRARDRMLEDFSDHLKSMPEVALAYPATPSECTTATPPSTRYAAEDRFDFVHCSSADEIRAHGLGVTLSL